MNSEKTIRARVSLKRDQRYKQALKAWAERLGLEPKFSEWVRRALDRQAEEDLRDTSR